MNYKTINVKIIILIVFFLHVAGVNAEEAENDAVYDFVIEYGYPSIRKE